MIVRSLERVGEGERARQTIDLLVVLLIHVHEPTSAKGLTQRVVET
jgi:hypothetical protein